MNEMRTSRDGEAAACSGILIREASVEDADMIIVLDGGAVADCGTHEELLARCEIYREVYESQTKGGEDE